MMTLREKTDMKLLHQILLQYFKPAEIEEHEDYHGFHVKPSSSQWTLLTAYLSKDYRRFSLYSAIPDVWRGIDIYDEEEICSMVPPHILKNNIAGYLQCLEFQN